MTCLKKKLIPKYINQKTTHYTLNLDSCEECKKLEPLKARQQNESATTTWAKTFNTYSTVAAQVHDTTLNLVGLHVHLHQVHAGIIVTKKRA
jgi:translation initiation factor 2 beta subunit (eIF-2beta)/eIF-5